MKWAYDKAKREVNERVFVKTFPGLFVRANKRGQIWWFFRFKNICGKKHTIRVGIAPVYDFDMARDRAVQILTQVQNGIDPRHGYTSRHVDDITLNEFFDTHYENLYDPESKWGKEVLALYNRHIRNTGTGKKKLSLIRPKDVKAAITVFTNQKKNVTANHILSIYKKALGHAEFEELIENDPSLKVKYPPVPKRNKLARPGALRRIYQACQLSLLTYHHRRSAIFVLSVMFTGSRLKQLYDAKWKDVEIQETPQGVRFGVLQKKGKSSYITGDEEVVIFPPQLLELYERYPDDMPFGGTFPKRYWERLRKQLNLGDLYLRDLRRSYASFAYSSGVDLDTVGELLNHGDKNTTAIYAKMAQTARVSAALQVGDLLHEKVQKKRR